MKKLILLFLIPFTMIMADFTLNGQALTPLNEEATVPSATTAPTTTSSTPTTHTVNYSTTGTAKTNWGFQPFEVPSNSVTVPAGGDIQAAIDSLPNGGTVHLVEGTYVIHQPLTFIGKSNIVVRGAGATKTIFKPVAGKSAIFSHCNNLASWDKHSPCMENLILRDFSIDGSGTAPGGTTAMVTFAWGISNLLMEGIEVYDIDGSGIVINNNNWQYNGQHITLKNMYVHNTTLHGVGVRFTKGVVIDNYHAHDLKQGVDLSSCKYAEISHVNVERALWGGMKFPSISHLYMHDVNIKDCHVLGIKLQEGTKYPPTEAQHLHLKNVNVENSGAGIIWIGIDNLVFNPPVIDMVAEGIHLINNRNNWDDATNQPTEPFGSVHTQIRMNIKIKDLYEFGDSIGITDTHPINYHKYQTETPEDIGVGWTSWPGIN